MRIKYQNRRFLFHNPMHFKDFAIGRGPGLDGYDTLSFRPIAGSLTRYFLDSYAQEIVRAFLIE